MASTYTPIASASFSGGTGTSVDFQSIPATHTDIVAVFNMRSNNSYNMYVRFNNDSTSNYSTTHIAGNGSSASSYRWSNETSTRLNSTTYSTSSAFAYGVMQVMSYSNSSVYKTALTASGAAGLGVERMVGLWRSTSAIDRITFLLGSTGAGQFVEGTISLYGIKAA